MSNYYAVSFIIPFSSGISFLSKSIDRFLRFKSDSYEVILVNDHCDNETSQWLVANAQLIFYSNIKIVSCIESGPGLARNLGISICHGKYISFLDIDDIWNTNAILKIAQNNNCDIYIYNHERQFPDGKLKVNRSDYILKELENSTILGINNSKKRGLFYNFNVCWNKIYLKDYIVKNNISMGAGIYEDLDWSFKCILHAESIKVTSDVLYTYVQHSNSTLKGKGLKHIRIMHSYAIIFDYINARGGGFKDVVIDKSLVHCYSIFSSARLETKVEKKYFLKELKRFSKKYYTTKEFLMYRRLNLCQKIIILFESVRLHSLYVKFKNIRR